MDLELTSYEVSSAVVVEHIKPSAGLRLATICGLLGVTIPLGHVRLMGARCRVWPQVYLELEAAVSSGST